MIIIIKLVTLLILPDNYMILIASKLLNKKVNAMAIYPFILLKDRVMVDNKRLINHERIHLRQQLELLIIPFYFLYFGEYIIRLLQYKNGYLAYKNISFEREAYTKEYDLNYLSKRRFFAFINYY